MKIRILAMGEKMPAWVDQGYADYAKRLMRAYDLELKTLSLLKRAKSQLSQVLSKESQSLLEQIDPQDWVVALDVSGKRYSTPALAERLEHWQLQSRSLVFVIGGPEGLHADILARADERLSLSQLTMPHPLVRVVFIEQLYRAWSILNQHPYHRE